jgi:signal transduction histidine kinase
VLNIAHSTAEKRGARLEFEADRSAPAAQAAIDPAQFKQILLNLLLNAIEAAPPGTAVRIACNAAPKTIELAVSDAGAGIPPEDAVRIFEPFYTTKTSGAGLGLAISRQLAVQAGGTLEIDRGHKPGARFVLTLPRAGDALLPSAAVVVAVTENPGATSPAIPGHTNS